VNAPEVTVVLPAYLEESTIESSVNRLMNCLDDYGIVFLLKVVVDGPGDLTADILSRIPDSRLQVIELDRNHGKGHAVRRGLADCTTDLVAYMDADLDLHPEGLAEAIRELQNSPAEVCGAIGSKVHPMSDVDYPLSRRILSRLFKVLVKFAFSLDVSDSQTGLKVFRRSAVEDVLPTLKREGFEFDLELLSRLSQRGHKFTEVPVQLDYHFETTVNVKTGMRALIDTMVLAIQLRRTRL